MTGATAPERAASPRYEGSPAIEVPERREAALQSAASLAFLLYVAALPWSIAAMSVGLALCGALTAAAWARNRWDWRPHAAIGWPMLGWIGALFLAAWFGQDRAAGLPRIGKGFLPLVAWMAAYHSRTPKAGRRALAVLLGSATVAALFGLALWIGKGAAYPERARGAAGHYMTFAGQLLLWIPVALGLALAARPWRRWVVPVALIGGVTLAATFTRSAWIGLFVATGVMLALKRPRWLVALVAAAALLVALAPAPYRARLSSAFDPENSANTERLHMWDAGARMFRDHPITGVGLMDLHAVYERYRSSEAREGAGHLHSVFVQIAASMGVIGLLAFGWLYSSLTGACAGGLRRRLAGGGLAVGIRLGATAALAGFLVAGCFEWNFGDEELLHLLYTLVGLAWAARAWPEEREAEAAAAAPVGAT